jgi:hypothetical protein
MTITFVSILERRNLKFTKDLDHILRKAGKGAETLGQDDPGYVRIA